MRFVVHVCRWWCADDDSQMMTCRWWSIDDDFQMMIHKWWFPDDDAWTMICRRWCRWWHVDNDLQAMMHRWWHADDNSQMMICRWSTIRNVFSSLRNTPVVPACSLNDDNANSFMHIVLSARHRWEHETMTSLSNAWSCVNVLNSN